MLPAHYVHTTLTDTILSKSIHIQTTDSAYVHLYAFGTNGGATSVIPTHALQPEYIVQTWPDINGGAFVILATEDSTTLLPTIFPLTPTILLPSMPATHINLSPEGMPQTIEALLPAPKSRHSATRK